MGSRVAEMCDEIEAGRLVVLPPSDAWAVFQMLAVRLPLADSGTMMKPDLSMSFTGPHATLFVRRVPSSPTAVFEFELIRQPS